MEKTVRDKISKWATTAWPVSSHVSEEDVYKKAWGHFGEGGCSLVTFKETLKAIGFNADLFGRVWILRLGNGKAQTIKSEGVT